MSTMEIKALENAGRDTMVWTEGYDEETHYSTMFKALAPAFLILTIVAGLLLAVL
ncbi:hypothetical protein [Devosia psychrophila]|jgi:hypothetical protein|uniref:Aa3 type cytochrome c oxidase subunit IV n=1 Tax=Devosia psychrophila TaxID=728005 RepID=A0A1I1IN75_9HYPH|nr:hypothetical protein [Devosia psychrophila]SFC35728.1 hypothetical protein SAMN04488059_104101 [Devosia psychrophila]